MLKKQDRRKQFKRKLAATPCLPYTQCCATQCTAPSSGHTPLSCASPRRARRSPQWLRHHSLLLPTGISACATARPDARPDSCSGTASGSGTGSGGSPDIDRDADYLNAWQEIKYGPCVTFSAHNLQHAMQLVSGIRQQEIHPLFGESKLHLLSFLKAAKRRH